MHTSKFESLTVENDADFPEYDDPPADPVTLVQRWLDRAVELQVREPKALALATADKRGRPSSRIVLVSAVDDRGVLFTSHATSRKGREIEENNWAAGLLYWRETGQQIKLSGPVEPVALAESDSLWQARAIPLHAMSAASRQSEPLADPAALRAEAARLGADGKALDRPERFYGYRLQPHDIEFWAHRPDRLHLRLRYDRDGDGWTAVRLQP
ncbi:phenazine biosynthesis FMN-dependent oxidase PhzG [Streptomyces sp. CMB-StM0423]|uniref:phenazine biosynthesis FMN-dependent oxidase PhzG n=1 Tax=Streptomyces sp. CMB-StM0423 TaxID=2059884 RepID=UPI000C707833|nr:phenazine biosynthesis FMN-dependent oxidase PhzG [Streptomyces sp. CMB-StM0423]AUH39453.1 pyridoxamine 5'-phosphate oxidase [Streptomyces sp. CMB-StM0423]